MFSLLEALLQRVKAQNRSKQKGPAENAGENGAMGDFDISEHLDKEIIGALALRRELIASFGVLKVFLVCFFSELKKAVAAAP